MSEGKHHPGCGKVPGRINELGQIACLCSLIHLFFIFYFFVLFFLSLDMTDCCVNCPLPPAHSLMASG